MSPARRPGNSVPTPILEQGLGSSSPPGGHHPPHLVKVLGVGTKVPVSGHPDQRIARIASAQHGRITRGQLLAIGISSSAIYTRVRSCQLHRLYSGVYAVGHTAPIEFADETAALLACGEHGVLSHSTAAGLWRLIPPSTTDRHHVTIPRNERYRPKSVRVHRSELHPSETRLVHRLPVTSPVRTLLDLAEDSSDRLLERALDEAFVRRLVRTSELERAAGSARGRRGAARLARLLETRSGPTLTRSEAEERFLALIRSAELPAPALNARLHGYEVDFYWPRHKLVVEVDGFQFHATRGAFERDRRKDAHLGAAKINVMRVTWRQLAQESFAVVARVARALA